MALVMYENTTQKFVMLSPAEASHCTFILMRFLDFARGDKNPIFLSAPLSC